MNGALLLILSLLAAPPTANAPAAATSTQALYQCDFSETADSDYDGWPDGWTRRRSREFPEFVEIEITPLPAFAKQEGVMGLQVGLAGGAASVSTPPIPITSKHSLEASVEVTGQNVRQSSATMLLTLLDAQGKTLESYSSAPYTGPQKQSLLTIGPIIPANSQAKLAVITLKVTAPTSQLDLKGDLWFSDLRLCKLPRMNLKANAELGLISKLDDAVISCQVSGLGMEQSELLFELFDHMGTRLAQSRHSLATAGPGSPAWQAFSLNTATVNNAAAAEAQARTLGIEEGARAASWKLPLKKHGFYRVKATMFAGDVALLSREMTLATLSTLPKSQVGEFGWSIPASQATLDLNPLAYVLSQSGIHQAKYPVWFGDAESDVADRVAWFAERLSLQNIEMVGVLDRPPASANTNALTDAASVFSNANDWQSAVDPVMTRLSLKVRRWQLGADNDMSFVGYPNLEAKVTEVKNHLERFGQEVRLGIPWRYTYELPEFQKPNCGFLAFSEEPGLTSAEIAEFLSTPWKGPTTPPVLSRSFVGSDPAINATPRRNEAGGTRANSASMTSGKSASPRPTQRWVSVDPLPAGDYAFDVRLADLVQRLVAAKTHGAEAIFATKPLDPYQGLLNPDGTPGELFLPWRTVATLLSGAQYVGQIELPGGSTNYIFAREKDAVMVIWNETETQEKLQLGEELTSVDVWGRQTPLVPTEETPEEPMGHPIKVGPIPQIITGVDAALARWQISVRFDSPRLESIFDREQTITLRFNNPFPRGISGDVSIAARKSWNIDARPQRYKLLPGDTAAQKIAVRLQPDASSGSQRVRIDFQVTESKSYRFSVYRVLHLGFEDIQIELSTRLLPGDILRVDQTFTNLSDTPASFQCLLFPPDRRRETQLVTNLTRESRTITYFLPNGEELIGKRLLMRAQELGGARVMNFGVIAER
ncbi:MAG: hypothetical protein ACO1RA_02765 [Planctomycetaceae bacterium]